MVSLSLSLSLFSRPLRKAMDLTISEPHVQQLKTSWARKHHAWLMFIRPVIKTTILHSDHTASSESLITTCALNQQSQSLPILYLFLSGFVTSVPLILLTMVEHEVVLLHRRRRARCSKGVAGQRPACCSQAASPTATVGGAAEAGFGRDGGAGGGGASASLSSLIKRFDAWWVLLIMGVSVKAEGLQDCGLRRLGSPAMLLFSHVSTLDAMIILSTFPQAFCAVVKVRILVGGAIVLRAGRGGNVEITDTTLLSRTRRLIHPLCWRGEYSCFFWQRVVRNVWRGGGRCNCRPCDRGNSVSFSIHGRTRHILPFEKSVQEMVLIVVLPFEFSSLVGFCFRCFDRSFF